MQKSLFIPLSCTFLHFLSSANISLVISIAKNELSCKKSQVIFLASNELFSWNCNICHFQKLKISVEVHPKSYTKLKNVIRSDYTSALEIQLSVSGLFRRLCK